MRTFLRTPKYVIPAALAVVGVLAWLFFGFFGFHLLVVDDEVDEALPVFASPAVDVAAPALGSGPVETTAPATVPTTIPSTVVEPTTPASAAPAPAPAEIAPTTTVRAEPVIVTEATGSFVSLDHETSGDVVVLGDGSGQRFLRFEDLATDNGPDLNVYLVNSSTGDTSDVVDLGDLKGNIGDQNYEIPVGADLSVYDTVVIWCVRFSSPFGEAVLSPV